MIRKIFIGLGLIIAFFAIIGAFFGTSSTTKTTYSSTKNKIKQYNHTKEELAVMNIDYVEKSLRATLKDGDSAKFKNVTYVKNKNGSAVCGYVNAKNSFGGYTGYKKFVGAGKAVFLENQVKDFHNVWNKLCVK